MQRHRIKAGQGHPSLPGTVTPLEATIFEFERAARQPTYLPCSSRVRCSFLQNPPPFNHDIVISQRIITEKNSVIERQKDTAPCWFLQEILWRIFK
jgi:hypothetical protein